MSLKTRPLTERIGTEILEPVDRLLSAGTGEALRHLLKARGVLLFPQIALSDEQQVALARSMGALREEGADGIFKITLDRKANERADYLKGSFLWHMDGTHDDVPVFASLLSGRVLSSTGGQTAFANSYAAYEALPAETKARIDRLQVVHSVEVSMTRAGIEPTPSNLAYWRSLPDKVHPLVWNHDSGRRSLVLGCHASHVIGLPHAEGEALLQELLDWTTRPEFVYRHEWRVGDLLIWDNTGVLHRAEPYALDSGRLMHRTTLLGEEAFA